MNDFDMINFDWGYSQVPKSVSGKRMGFYINKAFEDSKINEEQYERLFNKAITCHQKMNMIYYAREKAEEVRANFESEQNMEVPALFGMYKTKLLFYTESMILYARSALDVAAYFFSHFLLNTRKDSFNDFSKVILSSRDEKFSELSDFFEKESEDNTSAYRLLCGVARGRALRDIVTHQSNIRLEYYEYRENSEKEKLFIIIDKVPYAYDWFMEYFCEDVDNILSNVIRIMEKDISY